MKTKILLVEDEEGLADSLKTELELEDMVVIWAITQLGLVKILQAQDTHYYMWGLI